MNTPGIHYDERQRIYRLESDQMTYALQLDDQAGPLLLHFGARSGPLVPVEREHNVCSWNKRLNLVMRDYPAGDRGDLRYLRAFEVSGPKGDVSCSLRLADHEIRPGRPELPGLPSLRAEPGDGVQHLVLRYRDDALQLGVNLNYTFFPKHHAVARHTEFVNDGDAPVKLRHAASFSLDLPNDDYRLFTYNGAWAREMRRQESPLKTNRIETIGSRMGCSSHDAHPFMGLKIGDAGEEHGDVIGLSLIYSGSFRGQAVRTGTETLRMNLGLNPDDFERTLEPGEAFCTPQCVGIFSDRGVGEMSRRFHDLYRDRLGRPKPEGALKEVLINTWEPFYFDVTEAKVLELADALGALPIGVVMLDDGWFRDNDHSGLGDWRELPEKFPSGLEGLAEKLAQRGKKLGLWVEPEMVSRDSELYRAHPDWVLSVQGREQTEMRNQLVLDLSKPAVQEYLIDTLVELFSRVPLAFVKWDMNRALTEVGSLELPPERQRELPDRYIRALYRVIGEVRDELERRGKSIHFENCASGGARGDPGMLALMDTTWVSDNTDGDDRIEGQTGAGTILPAGMLSAHVSAVPNHQLERSTPLSLRTHVAMSGMLGFELDPRQLGADDMDYLKAMLERYQEIQPIVAGGDKYVLASPFDEGARRDFPAWMYVAKDRSSAVVTAIRRKAYAGVLPPNLVLRGLDRAASYRIEPLGETYSGAQLMTRGLPLAMHGDGASHLLTLVRVATSS